MKHLLGITPFQLEWTFDFVEVGNCKFISSDDVGHSSGL
jgi:hypothetical protein